MIYSRRYNAQVFHERLQNISFTSATVKYWTILNGLQQKKRKKILHHFCWAFLCANCMCIVFQFAPVSGAIEAKTIVIVVDSKGNEKKSYAYFISRAICFKLV